MNQPTCENFPFDTEDSDSYTLFQFASISNFDFSEKYIKNDNYAGGEVVILDYNPGLSISISDKTKVSFTSVDYVTGILEFTFKAKNNYYESDICIGKITVKACHPNCKKCSEESTSFTEHIYIKHNCIRGTEP